MANSVTALTSAYPALHSSRQIPLPAEDAHVFACFVDQLPVSATIDAVPKEVRSMQPEADLMEELEAKPLVPMSDEGLVSEVEDLFAPAWALPQLIATLPPEKGTAPTVAPVVIDNNVASAPLANLAHNQTSSGQDALLLNAETSWPFPFGQPVRTPSVNTPAAPTSFGIDPKLPAQVLSPDNLTAPLTSDPSLLSLLQMAPPDQDGFDQLALPADLSASAQTSPLLLAGLTKPDEQMAHPAANTKVGSGKTVDSQRSKSATQVYSLAASVSELAFRSIVAEQKHSDEPKTAALTKPGSDAPMTDNPQTDIHKSTSNSSAAKANPDIILLQGNPIWPRTKPELTISQILPASAVSDRNGIEVGTTPATRQTSANLSNSNDVGVVNAIAEVLHAVNEVGTVSTNQAFRPIPDQLQQLPITSDRNPDGYTQALSAPVALPNLVATVTMLAKDHPSQITGIQLDPIELGSVSFNMDTGPAGLIITVTADRPETLELMRRHADQFIADLRQSGFSGASLQFGQSQNAPADQGSHQPQQNQNYKDGGDNNLPTEALLRPALTLSGSGLDLRL